MSGEVAFRVSVPAVLGSSGGSARVTPVPLRVRWSDIVVIVHYCPVSRVRIEAKIATGVRPAGLKRL